MAFLPLFPFGKSLGRRPMLGLLFLVFFLMHCGSVKYPEMLMLDEVQDTTLDIDSIPALTIRPDDILDIQVTSRNPETVVAFQLNRQEESQGGSGERAYGADKGYRVDEEGFIYLPFLGKVKASGKTIIQLREEVAEELVKYIPDASLQVRFLNFRVTVLGEVERPNTYIIPNEKLTLLEAIGMAGDFTPYAKRNEVLVIREREMKRELGRVDTQVQDLFESPYFYLSPNDIVYVEPLKAKKYATQGDFLQRYSGVLLPLVSLVTFAIGISIAN